MSDIYNVNLSPTTRQWLQPARFKHQTSNNAPSPLHYHFGNTAEPSSGYCWSTLIISTRVNRTLPALKAVSTQSDFYPHNPQRVSHSFKLYLNAQKRLFSVFKTESSPVIALPMRPKMDTAQYLADHPPTVVPLTIKPHFEALTQREKLYAHYLSR